MLEQVLHRGRFAVFAAPLGERTRVSRSVEIDAARRDEIHHDGRRRDRLGQRGEIEDRCLGRSLRVVEGEACRSASRQRTPPLSPTSATAAGKISGRQLRGGRSVRAASTTGRLRSRHEHVRQTSAENNDTRRRDPHARARHRRRRHQDRLSPRGRGRHRPGGGARTGREPAGGGRARGREGAPPRHGGRARRSRRSARRRSASASPASTAKTTPASFARSCAASARVARSSSSTTR